MDITESLPRIMANVPIPEEERVDQFIAVMGDFFLDVAYQEEKLSEKGLTPLSQTSFLLKKAIEVSLRFLLEKRLTEKEREAVEKLVLKLEPSGSSFSSSRASSIEKVAEVTFSYFSPENDILGTFFTLLSTLHKSSDFTAAEALVKLIIELVKMDPTLALHPFFAKTIELIQGHVTCLSTLLSPCVVQIPLYQEFFDSYLEMVALRMKLSFSPEMSLQDKYERAISYLKKKRGESRSEELLFALRHLAFLTSRYEWISFQDRFLAMECLETMLTYELDGISKNGIYLQIVLQEVETLFQDLDLQHEVTLTVFKGILRKLLTFLVQGQRTLSDAILATYLRFLVTLEMEKRCKECPKAIQTTLLLLEDIIEKGKVGRKELSLLAAVLVDVSNLEWIFYAFFVGSNENLEKSRQKMVSSESISSIVADSEVKEKLRGFYLDSSQERIPFLITPSLLSSLERLKFLIYGNIAQFIRKTIWCQYNEKNESLTVRKVQQGARRDAIFEQIQKEIFSNGFSSFEGSLSEIFTLFAREASQRWQEGVEGTGVYPIAFLRGIDATQATIDFEKVTLCKNQAELFFHGLLSNPFLIHLWTQEIKQQIERNELVCVIPEKTIGRALLSSGKVQAYEFSFILILHLFVERFSSFLRQYEGNPGLAYQVHEILDCMMRWIDNEEVSNLFTLNLKGLSRKEEKRIVKARHHVPTLVASTQLALRTFSYTMRIPLFQEKDIVGFYEHLHTSLIVVGWIFPLEDPEKFWWADQLVQVMKNYAEYVDRRKIPGVDMQNLALHTFIAEISKSQLIQDSQGGLRERTAVFSRIPNNLEGIKRHFLFDKESIKGLETITSFIFAFKCHNLIENQQVEEGLSLYAAYKEDPILKKIPIDGALSAQAFLVLFNIKLLNRKQLNRKLYSSTVEFEVSLKKEKVRQIESRQIESRQIESKEPHFVPEAAKESMHPSSPSLKKEILEGHKEIEQRRIKKQDDKLARNKEMHHDLNLSSMMGPSKPEVKEVVKAISSPTIPMKEKVFEIFMRFFEQNDPHEQGPWENRSYRSDIPVKRPELLKVIEALNGEHHTSRKGSSHSIAHLPKTTLKGIELGLNDRDEGELLITLTKDIDLKYYLISQVRKVFIQCGFTPDTVFGC